MSVSFYAQFAVCVKTFYVGMLLRAGFLLISQAEKELITSSNSLPPDVLWGSFVTHSFLPHGRNECVTNEPQRMSAGRLQLKLPWTCPNFEGAV